MMLIEQSAVPDEALPIVAFRDHLRLGSGFADDAAQDAVLGAELRAALAVIEGRTGKVLIRRRFGWTVTQWGTLSEQALPVAPVQEVVSIALSTRQGEVTAVDLARVRLVQDMQRPLIVATGAVLPQVPLGGTAEVVFEAGFAPVWGDLPGDLAQAVMMLAAHYYEHRFESAAQGGAVPFGVAALIERYRTVRLLGGGAR